MNDVPALDHIPALYAGDAIKDRVLLISEKVKLDGRDPNTLKTELTFSEGLAEWMQSIGASVAFTTYDSGGLHLVGQDGTGRVTVAQNRVMEASGLANKGKDLYVGTRTSIRIFKDISHSGYLFQNIHDKTFVPRVAYLTSILDIHELNFDKFGRLLFVNSRYSCIATLHPTHSFMPVWKPFFISALLSEDRCHLNGMAVVDGELRYASAFMASDNGWRDKETDRGIILDTRSNKIIAEGFIKPHSPRYYQESLWVLDSGRGQLVKINPITGTRDNVVFVPGFLKGLSFLGNYAALTCSRPRDETFIGMDLEAALKSRSLEAWCAVFFVDLTTGEIVHWIRLNGRIREMLDVIFLTDARCPWVGTLTSIGKPKPSGTPMARAGAPSQIRRHVSPRDQGSSGSV